MTADDFDDADLQCDVYPHVLIYGATGAGKTCLASTAPGPRVVIATEGNSGLPLRQPFTTIPRVYLPADETSRRATWGRVVRSWTDVERVLSELPAVVAARGIRTVIVDNVTGIADLCRYSLLGTGPTTRAHAALTQAQYGSIFLQLDGLKHRLRQLPATVVWVCGAKEAEDEGSTVRRTVPDIVGQSARRLPAACQMVLYVQRLVGAGGRAAIQVHTVPSGTYEAKAYGLGDGAVAPIEAPDLMVLLAKTGWLPPEEAAAVLESIQAERPATSVAGGTRAPATRGRGVAFHD